MRLSESAPKRDCRGPEEFGERGPISGNGGIGGFVGMEVDISLCGRFLDILIFGSGGLVEVLIGCMIS